MKRDFLSKPFKIPVNRLYLHKDQKLAAEAHGAVSMKKDIRFKIDELAHKYSLSIIYVFGSRAREVVDTVNGVTPKLIQKQGGSDIDIALLPFKLLSIDQKVMIATEFEDLFGAHRVDVVVLPETSPFLAYEAVTGELLYARDADEEAKYQLYIINRAADLFPHQKDRFNILLEKTRAL